MDRDCEVRELAFAELVARHGPMVLRHLPDDPTRFPRRRGRLSGYVPGARSAGQVDPPAGLGGELAAWRRPASRPFGPIGRSAPAGTRTEGGRDDDAIGRRSGMERPGRRAPSRDRTPPGEIPLGDRAVRPEAPHRRPGRAASRVADRHVAHPVTPREGPIAGPPRAPWSGTLGRVAGGRRVFRCGVPVDAGLADAFHDRGGGRTMATGTSPARFWP